MAEQQSLADIVKSIQSDVTAIVKGEIELVKAELIPQAKVAGLGAGLLGGAAFIAITGATLLFVGLSFLLSLGFVAWFSLPVLGGLAWGFSIMAVLLFLVAGGLALIARQRMVFTKPEAAIAQAEATAASVGSAITETFSEINSLSLTGSTRQPELE